MRMSMRRFTRLTNAFSKKLDNHKAAVAFYTTWYNFARIHPTLRVTPAMEAGNLGSRVERGGNRATRRVAGRCVHFCPLAETTPVADNLAVTHPWHGHCAWCDQIIRREPVADHGVRYHALCWTTREAVLGPELARDRLEDAR
jgi:hypothetical protein